MSDRVDADAYARVFEGHHEGVLILDDLVRRFGGALFVKGGEEGRRQTDYNLGRRSVLDFIMGQINQSHHVAPTDEDDSQPAG
jgi:hypothetical protein